MAFFPDPYQVNSENFSQIEFFIQDICSNCGNLTVQNLGKGFLSPHEVLLKSHTIYCGDCKKTKDKS